MTQSHENKEAATRRPLAWDDLYANEKELARVNYEKEEERYRFLTEKAKATFAVAAFIGSFGLGKLDSVLSFFAGATHGLKYFTFFLVGVLLLSLSTAVIFALIALKARKCKAVSRGSDYVDDLYDKDKDTINRSISDIYQSTADDNWKTNEELAGQVNRAMLCTTVSFVAAMLLIGTYAFATYCDTCGAKAPPSKGVVAVTAEKAKSSDADKPKQVKPVEPVKVKLRTVTEGDKGSSGKVNEDREEQ